MLLVLLERLLRQSQSPGGLWVEELGECAMRPLPVGKPRLEAQRSLIRQQHGAPARVLAAISISPTTAFGRPFSPALI